MTEGCVCSEWPQHEERCSLRMGAEGVGEGGREGRVEVIPARGWEGGGRGREKGGGGGRRAGGGGGGDTYSAAVFQWEKEATPPERAAKRQP